MQVNKAKTNHIWHKLSHRSGWVFGGLLLLSCAKQPNTVQNHSDLIDLKRLVPTANYDIRYFSSNNFVGKPIAGYQAPKCIIHHSAAKALQAINIELESQNMRLKVFDCYRPQRAVTHFMAWLDDVDSQQTKTEYYPNLTKAELKGDYIAEQSGHSRGYTVDLTIEAQQPDGRYEELDMGSPFDLFDEKSNTLSPLVKPQQTKNRLLLRDLMLKHGFSDYTMEWWHFTHRTDPRNKYHNFEVN